MADEQRFTLRPARGGGWIVFDEERGENAAFHRRGVQLTFSDRATAARAAINLNAEEMRLGRSESAQ